VLVPYNVHPKTISLIECAKNMWLSKYLIFPKNKKTLFKNKKFSLKRMNLLPTYFHSKWKIRDQVVLNEKKKLF